LVFSIAIVSWRWNWRWLLVAGSALAVLAANSLLMAWITGDPLHVFHVIQKNMQTPNPVLSPTRGRSPDYYFKYLFIDIKHTWLLAYIALGGLILIVKNWGWAKRDWNSGICCFVVNRPCSGVFIYGGFRKASTIYPQADQLHVDFRGPTSDVGWIFFIQTR
jgi:hypothetical protein